MSLTRSVLGAGIGSLSAALLCLNYYAGNPVTGAVDSALVGGLRSVGYRVNDPSTARVRNAVSGLENDLNSYIPIVLLAGATVGASISSYNGRRRSSHSNN